MRHYELQKRNINKKIESAVILGPFWMVGHGLVDEVTGYVDDVSTFMVDLERFLKNGFVIQDDSSAPLERREGTKKNGTMAVSSRAMRRVPVTRRKMMKMLMILSRDRSNHTIIYVHREEEEDEIEGWGGGGRDVTESRNKVSTILKRLETCSDQTHRETCVLPV